VASVRFLANGIQIGVAAAAPYQFVWTPTASGSYVVVAQATDNSGNVTTSSSVTVTVTGNLPPVVSITAPGSGNVLQVGTSVNFNAAASDADGTIASVRFFANNVLVATVATAPYNATWTPVALGSYSLTAVATDNSGATTTSTAVIVTVTGNAPPSVALTSPATGTSVTAGTPVTVAANASDTDGTIASVRFTANGITIGTAAAAPYRVTWTPTAGGTYSLVAIATDNSGNITVSSSISVTVTTNQAPTVSITAPTTGSALQVGNAATVTATASDSDGTVASVQFFANGVSIATVTTVPYNAAWTPTALGSYSLTAVATDNSGATTTSAPVTVTVTANAAPSVTLTSPAAGTTVSAGTPVTVSANASDADGTVTSVRFLANNISIGVAATAPYRATWTPTASGSYVLVAQATDNSGNITNSSSLTVTVTGNVPPVVSITAPAASSVLQAGSITSVVATASDADGTVSSVQFFANGVSIGSVSAAPYTVPWTPVAPGNYSLTAIATDNAFATTTSSAVAVTVNANAAPTVTLTSPTTGSTVVAGLPVSVSANASDSDGTVTSVRFTANGITIGTAATAPYRVTWTPSGGGSYALVAIATDNSGNITNSSAVTVTVNANQPPVVSITSPATGSNLQVGNSVTVTATASDPDGTVTSVQFFANGVSIATKTAPPYTTAWTPLTEGVFHLTAVATDNAAATTTSADVAVQAVTATSANSASIYTGIYNNGFETGKFALMAFGGKTVTFIARSTGGTTGAPNTYYYTGVPMDSSGNFTVTTGSLVFAGTVTTGGVSGTIAGGTTNLLFVGSTPNPTGTAFGASGFYSGNLTSHPASALAAIVGADSSITTYVKDTGYADVAIGQIDGTGAFSLTTATGNTLTGRVDPTTGFLTGALSGSASGNLTAALASGGSLSDGALRNLSTRGQVGSGPNVLITGFIVSGTAAKNVLIRGVGPTLGSLGINSPLADPQLQVFTSAGVAIPGALNNTGWNPADAAAMASVGAFPLPVGSKDADLKLSLAPALYTTQLSSISGGTGVALIEFYDLDPAVSYPTQKVVNVSTRGLVGTGQNVLIAGFVISGNTPKKVLIRAVGGTTLGGFGVAGTLADPFLTLQRQVAGVYSTVRENDDWESGNDAALVAAATTKAGAFPLPSGSKDSVLLVTLPPGTYSTIVTGNGTSTGIALVEVYEVP
jgi:chitodextrinase